MNETMFNRIGCLVRYIGDTREGLYDLIGIVEKDNGKSSGVRFDNPAAATYVSEDGLVWAANWAWTEVEDIHTTAQVADLDSMFTEASGGKLAVAQAEISRLEARLAELKAFVEVYKSL